MSVKVVFVPNKILLQISWMLDAQESSVISRIQESQQSKKGFKNHNNQRRKKLEWILIKDFFQKSKKIKKIKVMDRRFI